MLQLACHLNLFCMPRKHVPGSLQGLAKLVRKESKGEAGSSLGQSHRAALQVLCCAVKCAVLSCRPCWACPAATSRSQSASPSSAGRRTVRCGTPHLHLHTCTPPPVHLFSSTCTPAGATADGAGAAAGRGGAAAGGGAGADRQEAFQAQGQGEAGQVSVTIETNLDINQDGLGEEDR